MYIPLVSVYLQHKALPWNLLQTLHRQQSTYRSFWLGGEEHFKEKAREAAMKPCCPQWRAVCCTKSFEAFSNSFQALFKLFSSSFEVFNHSENHFLWQIRVQWGFKPSESRAYRTTSLCKLVSQCIPHILPRPYSVYDFYHSTGCSQAQLPENSFAIQRSRTLQCPALIISTFDAFWSILMYFVSLSLLSRLSRCWTWRPESCLK